MQLLLQTFKLVSMFLQCLQQLQEQLDTIDAAADLCPPPLKLGLEEVQQRVVVRWEELRDYTEQRGEDLKLAYQRYIFNNTVKTPVESLSFIFFKKYIVHLFIIFCFSFYCYYIAQQCSALN